MRKSAGRCCSDDTNVCVTYLKFDMLQSLPTDVYVFSFTTVPNTVHMLCITGVDDNLAGKKTYLIKLLSN